MKSVNSYDRPLAWGANLRHASYSANNLNQYTSRSVPPYFSDLGSANSNATVTLWNADGSHAPAYRHDDYFRAELPVNNSTGALCARLSSDAANVQGVSSSLLYI